MGRWEAGSRFLVTFGASSPRLEGAGCSPWEEGRVEAPHREGSDLGLHVVGSPWRDWAGDQHSRSDHIRAVEER